MFEKNLDQLYVEVIQQVNNMIPTNWKDFWLCADLDEQCNGGVYFFFSDTNGKIIYSLDIPDIYCISEKEFNSADMKLFYLVREIKLNFIENGMDAWFQMIMQLEDNRKMSIIYDYVNWFKSPFTTNDLIDYFEYKYVGNHSNKIGGELVKKIEDYKKNL